ncbi:MAG: 30S ribosomal protein S12 methylthiotransferase RimO [Candidatus Margulisiibacteriota bacterium]
MNSAKKAYIVSLGCPKNLSDTEAIMGNLVCQGYQITNNPAEAETIVVNTCAFLKSARDEAMSTIKEMASWKKKGRCKQLLIAGCLPKWEGRQKEADGIRGVDGVIESIQLYNCSTPRIKATPPWYAYVKIAEGCSNCCTYCLIPKIRGKLRTRPVADIIKEVSQLAQKGVKEIIYIAQDTTAHPQLAEILKKTAKIAKISWIRLMYAHPKHLTDKVIDIMAKEPKIVKYLDLPIQHVCDKILNRMNRPEITGPDLYNLVDKIRKRIPSIALRTSVIVGFPGEGEAEFSELCKFLEKVKFERLGAYPFSKEIGTPAAKMRGQVSQKQKEVRFHRVMQLQKGISKERNKQLIGKVIETIIEGVQGGQYIGRSYMDAPEIDGRVLTASHKSITPGEIVKVKVTKALPYDLIGYRV